MGEIAEMMLDGTLCEGCGVSLPGEALGFPRRCKDCRRLDRYQPPKAGLEKVACPQCGKRVKSIGLRQHQFDSHGKVV